MSAFQNRKAQRLHVASVNVYHGETVGPGGVYKFPDQPGRFLVAVPAGGGEHGVKDKVCMGGAGDHAEIMDADGGIQLFELFRNLMAHMGNFRVVRFNGIHVDGGGTAETLLDFHFRPVNGVMETENIPVAADLRVEGYHEPAGAVVMDDQVVNTDNFRMGHDSILNTLYQFRIRRLAKKRGEGFPGGVVPGEDDKGCHGEAGEAVDIDMEKPGDAHGKEDHGGGDGVGQGICGGGLHGGGMNFSADALVVMGHVELYGDGDEKNERGQKPRFHRLGRENFFHGAFAQLHAHQNDDHRKQKARQIFDPAVAERMIQIRLLAGKHKAEQRDNGGAGV